jgi:hypothetical protein
MSWGGRIQEDIKAASGTSHQQAALLESCLAGDYMTRITSSTSIMEYRGCSIFLKIIIWHNYPKRNIQVSNMTRFEN